MKTPVVHLNLDGDWEVHVQEVIRTRPGHRLSVLSWGPLQGIHPTDGLAALTDDVKTLYNHRA